MQLYFTTTVRGAPLKNAGEFVRLDWEKKEVVARVPIFPSNPEFDDPNPRGGGRGGRGITVWDDNLMVASCHTLHIYDKDLNHQYDVLHPLFVGLHEIESVRPDHVWVTSTTLDLLLEIDVKGRKLNSNMIIEEFWARELPGIQEALGVAPLIVDKTADNRIRYIDSKYVTDPNHLHLSAMAHWQGDTFALFGFHGIIANLSQQTVLVSDPELKPGHNLHVLEDGTVVVLGTYSRTIRFYNLATGALEHKIDLMEFKWVRDLLRWRDWVYRGKRLVKETILRQGKAARPLFLRGLDIVGGKLYVGATPAIILCIDLYTGKLRDTFVYSPNILIGIHGIKVMDG